MAKITEQELKEKYNFRKAKCCANCQHFDITAPVNCCKKHNFNSGVGNICDEYN